MNTSGKAIASLVAVAAVVASVLSAASAPPGPGPAPASQVPQVSEAPDAASAAQAAHLQGSRVEVLGERTPTQQVFANPGGTMTTELSAVPVRVKRGSEWLPIDTTVVARPDGVVGPRAAVGDASFSGGGSSAPLASLHRDGRTLSLFWPGELPEPELSGNAATYPEVLPGVDLVMRAERNGLQQHLVVKTRAAAGNPALASIRMGLKADGLTVRVDEAGALHAADAAGTEVFTAPPPTMWDSAGHSTRFGVSVVDGGLVLAPDLTFLADPAVVYPVTVDPAFATFERNAWATVLSGKPEDEYWWTSGEPGVAQVGQCYRENPDRCNGIREAWAYFQFDTGFLWDKAVHEITLNTTVVYSPSCTVRNNVLHGSFATINAGTNWTNKPDGPRIAEFGAPVSCGGWKGIGFNLGANYNPSGFSAYSLRAADGGDQLAWRKYRPEDTKVIVKWNRAPYPPNDMHTDPPLRTPCKWCAGKSYVGDAGIRFIGRLWDPDNDAVDPQFEINWLRPDGSTERTINRGWGLGFVPSGQSHSTHLDLTNEHGKTIGWRLRTGDGTAQVGDWRDGPGPFVVDRKGITAEPAVSSAAYPEDNAWHGAVGAPGQFTFKPGATCNPQNDVPGVCDIDHYLYGWSDPPSTKVDADALGGNATVTLAPPGDGPRTLHVQSVDRAGHKTTKTKHYRFYVRAGNGARSQWSLEGNANDSAFLGDRHGALSGNATYRPGAVGTGLDFDGAGTSLMTAPNTVRTDASFSVSAWVRLDQLGSGAVAVEQRGTKDAGFALQFHAQLKKWVFVMPGADVDPQTSWRFVESPAAAAVDTWTHLAGTYDGGSRLMTMYVNGNPVGTNTRLTPWNAAGAVQVGRSWDGMVDEVQLYDRVLGPAEVKAVVSRDNVQAGHWKFDDKDGTTAENSVEGGDSGVLKDGATFTDSGMVNRAVQLDGVDDHVVTGRPAVRTDQSFTVAAWVRADRFVTGPGAQTAVSQDGNRNSGFYLQYNNQIQKWVFLRFTTDADTPTPGWIGVSASQQPAAGVPTHLAGTFDGASRKMTIYVNGQYGGEGVLPVAPWDASGPLTIGRAKFAGQFTDYWPGAVDEVRMYSRVLSPAELEGIVSRNDVPVASWKLDGNANDESANNRDGQLKGNPAWTSGQSQYPDPADLALNLDGGDDYVAAAPVVNTIQSYSVSAWVRLGQKDPTKFYSAVSQSGTQTQSFTLGYSGKDDRWAFQINGTNTEPPATFKRVMSVAAGQTGVWTHLAAVYQAGSGEMRLYVNGVSSTTAQFTGGFDAATEFAIGRTTFAGNGASYFAGAIDDVKAYSRPLFANEVRVMAGRDMSLVHNWRLDEPSGSGAADHAGNRPGTVSGGVTRSAGRVGNAVRFGATPGAVTTAGVDVPTDQRFTVSAWVNLDDPGCGMNCPPTRSIAVSVDGGSASTSSKFRLGHRIDTNQAPVPYGKWIFDMPRKDGGIDEAAISVRPGQFNKWVFLVGVYDAPANQLWLYVYSDGNEPDVDSGTLIEPWKSTGGLRIGGSLRNSQAADAWRGSVDDVRLYTGDLDADRLSALHRSYPASAPSPTSPVPDKGHWTFDENTGTTAADSSGRELDATLTGGAGWQGGRIDHSNMFNGTTGFAETAGPVVDTMQSFSVSAWAYLSTGGGGHRTVIAQDGDTVSAFLLQYQPENMRWSVKLPTTDELNPSTVVLTSTGPAMLSPWTHLVLTYDAHLRQVRLYVNGLLSAIRVGVSMINSTGPLSIGRGKWNGDNVEYLAGSVDDVRAFDTPLSDGEVRRIHDDAPAVVHGYWGFEGAVEDTSWRHSPTTRSPAGTSFAADGVRGQALTFDGVSGSVTTQNLGVNMMDSFTVSAWATLSHTDRDATIAGQDGTRNSAFLLQYNKDVGRWIFGASAQDADFGQLVYAHSPQAPAVNAWTQLTGVYDYPARQLRLYVNGELVDIQDDAPLWPASSGLTIGRGKENGASADFFTGTLDEVRIDFWSVPDTEIAQRASHPAPAGGQLGRFVNSAGERHSINSTDSHEAPFGSIPAGYRFDGPLGQLLTTEQPGTRTLYACKTGTDEFTSTDVSCGGATKLADLGWAYTTQPANVPTIALYGCTMATGRFDSLDPNCEGKTRVEPAPLGYTVAYAVLSRYLYRADWEDTVTVYGAKPGYRREGTSGLLAMTDVAGTQPLWSCRDGIDEFATTDPACAGMTQVVSLGRLWTEPPSGAASRPLYLCRTTAGERFNSYASDCNGSTVVTQLGHILSSVPPPPSE